MFLSYHDEERRFDKMKFCKWSLKEIIVFDNLTVTGKQFQSVAPEYWKCAWMIP